MSKSLYELKNEQKKGAKNTNTITDSDYMLRDKKSPKDKKNTVWMTPNPAETKRRLEEARKQKAELEELEKLEAVLALKEVERLKAEADKKAETEAKRQATLAKKKADEEAKKDQ